MAPVVRLYDVEPKPDRPGLPAWAIAEPGFPLDEIPHIGDELKLSEWSTADSGFPADPPVRGETHYWRVVRRTQDLHPQAQIAVLGVRFIS